MKTPGGQGSRALAPPPCSYISATFVLSPWFLNEEEKWFTSIVLICGKTIQIVSLPSRNKNIWLFKNVWLQGLLLEIVAMAERIILFKAAKFYETNSLSISLCT